jgi:hypothetical protein
MAGWPEAGWTESIGYTLFTIVIVGMISMI